MSSSEEFFTKAEELTLTRADNLTMVPSKREDQSWQDFGTSFLDDELASLRELEPLIDKLLVEAEKTAITRFKDETIGSIKVFRNRISSESLPDAQIEWRLNEAARRFQLYTMSLRDALQKQKRKN